MNRTNYLNLTLWNIFVNTIIYTLNIIINSNSSLHFTSYLWIEQIVLIFILIRESLLVFNKVDGFSYGKLLILSRYKFSALFTKMVIQVFLAILLSSIITIYLLSTHLSFLHYIYIVNNLYIYYITINLIIGLFRKYIYNYYVIYIISILIYIPFYIIISYIYYSIENLTFINTGYVLISVTYTCIYYNIIQHIYKIT